ncbi:MAG: RNA polymerase sigma factor [Mangrovibacterium sp.]
MTKKEFEQQVKINQEPLRRFLINLCSGDSGLGDDLAQEAFLKAYTKLQTFNSRSKFSTWLFRIAYNCFCDYQRKARQCPTTELDQGRLSSFPETDSALEEEDRMLYQALSMLGEKENVCILLYYMEEKSIKEVSSITGIKENTVKSHLSRGKKKLAEHLTSIGYERR